MHAFTLLILVAITGAWGATTLQRNEWGTLKLQPELDNIDVSAYLKNERFIKLQLKCLLQDGPCDIVGKFFKPRVKAALEGECLVCTEQQTKNLINWRQVLIDQFPDYYRALQIKYLKKDTATADDKAFLEQTVHDDGFDRVAQKLKEGSPQVGSNGAPIKTDQSTSTTTTTEEPMTTTGAPEST